MTEPGWTNFAGDQTCRPASFESPASRAAVTQIIGRVAAAGQKVRVASGGHSFTTRQTALTTAPSFSCGRTDHDDRHHPSH